MTTTTPVGFVQFLTLLFAFFYEIRYTSTILCERHGYEKQAGGFKQQQMSVCLIVEKKILLSLYKPKGDGI